MRTLMKMFLPIILALSLSILAQPQPGSCVTPSEYGLILKGTVATVKDGFCDATIHFSVDDFLPPTDPLPPFFTGKVNIKVEDGDKTVYDSIFDYTAYADVDESSIFITTTGAAILSGTFTVDYGQLSSISLVLQMHKEGMTGKVSVPWPL